jgi:hypothetical protein
MIEEEKIQNPVDTKQPPLEAKKEAEQGVFAMELSSN